VLQYFQPVTSRMVRPGIGSAPQMKPSKRQRLAARISSSILFRKGQRLWEANAQKWDLPLSKWEKLQAGVYLMLNDYASGVFPPRFEDQAQAYQNEINFKVSLPGYSLAEADKVEAVKPFWQAATEARYLRDFSRLHTILEAHGVRSGDRLLELGCGPGWMAEFLALAGYRVIGTTLSEYDIALANQKAAAVKCREIPGILAFDLRFLIAPMETIDEVPDFIGAFDAAYVYQALHHAYDWRKALRATANTLKPRGCLVIASEPNWLHTFVSYREGRLSKTHEIGFSRKELVCELEAAGFSTVQVLAPRINNGVTHHWILARKDD
jgi:cyclopropane fatty-acyl-phospholipid synthase-like methyltransferase